MPLSSLMVSSACKVPIMKTASSIPISVPFERDISFFLKKVFPQGKRSFLNGMIFPGKTLLPPESSEKSMCGKKFKVFLMELFCFLRTLIDIKLMLAECGPEFF